MKSKFIKRVLILVASLIVLTAFSNIAYSADANSTDRYALPPSKVNIEPCQREALRLHPGVIEKQRMLRRHGEFLIRYEIQASDGLEWFMLCDLGTGKIIDSF
jgi:hypothetical protein